MHCSIENGGRGFSELAAGIVIFGGSEALLGNQLETLRDLGLREVFAFVNGWALDGVRDLLRRDSLVTVINAAANQGVGSALNCLVEHAERTGAKYVMLLDQDSRLTADLLPPLVARLRQFREVDVKAAAIGPRLAAPRGSQFKGPRYQVVHGFSQSKSAASPMLPVHYLPTSGTLISIDAFREIGPFRDDYFIDGIDLEWCFRAWSKGYSCWLATDVTMEHTVGEGAVGAFGFRTPHQKDFRLETYVRNTVYGFRLPHIPLSWKLRQAAYLVAQVAFLSVANHFRPSLLKRLGRGFVNGLRGRLGPPEGVPFT